MINFQLLYPGLLIPDGGTQDDDDISDRSEETLQESEAIVVQDFGSIEKQPGFSAPLLIEPEGMQLRHNSSRLYLDNASQILTWQKLYLMLRGNISILTGCQHFYISNDAVFETL